VAETTRKTMTHKTDLINGPIDSSLRLFSVPLAFSFLVNMVYSLIDRFYASRLGDTAIAAIGSSDQVSFFLFTMGSGLAVGTGIIVSRRFGEGAISEANTIATQGVVGITCVALLVTAIVYALMPHIPGLMNMPGDVAVHALAYMGTLYLGFAANLVSFQIFTIVRSTGNSVFPMVVLISTTILNAAIAPFLIFGFGPFPRMELAGAGLATAIAQICGASFAVWSVTAGKVTIRLSLRNYRPDFTLLKSVARLGLPSAIQMLAVSVNRGIIFVIVGGFGTSVTAAYTLGLNLDMMVFMSVFAIGVAVEVATGQNLGAGKPERVAAFHTSAMKQTTTLMLTLGLLVWLFGEWFARLYTHTPETVTEVLRYQRSTSLGYAAFAIGLVTVRSISGAGAAYTSMLVTVGSLLFMQLPLCYVLSHQAGLGSKGVWMGLVMGNFIFAGIALVVHRKGSWRSARV